MYSKDPKPVTCFSKEFWFDDLGVLHLKYFSDKHKILRDYIFTSDNYKTESLYDIKDRMESRIAERKKKRNLLTVACVVGVVVMINITIMMLYCLTQL